MKYARKRTAFSEGSPVTGVTSGCGDAEICAARSVASLVPRGVRGFFPVVARLGVWRLPVFFVATVAPDSGEG
jgi:hypothetical protein